MSAKSENEESKTKDDIASFLDQFESLEIPANIDPKLLALWLQRERAEIARRQGEKEPVRIAPRHGRTLSRLFAAYIGIIVMCFVIVLGLVQGRETGEILTFACQAFLIYTVIGFVVGWIAEYCVTDSVETLLREIVRRGDEAGAQAAKNEPETQHSEVTG